MKKTHLSDQDREEIVRDYTVNGFDQHTLARTYQICEKRLRAILVAAGVDIQVVSNKMRSESQKRRLAA